MARGARFFRSKLCDLLFGARRDARKSILPLDWSLTDGASRRVGAARPYLFSVAQTSESAVSRVSNPAGVQQPRTHLTMPKKLALSSARFLPRQRTKEPL